MPESSGRASASNRDSRSLALACSCFIANRHPIVAAGAAGVRLRLDGGLDCPTPVDGPDQDPLALRPTRWGPPILPQAPGEWRQGPLELRLRPRPAAVGRDLHPGHAAIAGEREA